MAKTVGIAFSEFNKETVNLNPDRTSKANSSRDWLWGQLNTLDSKDNLDFPFKYQDKHIKFGSFARKTKIRELDDIDIMFCFIANGATYLKSGSVYYIHTPNAGDRLKKLSDNDILNSRKVVNKVKNSLSEIEHYKSADIHSKGEAATLSLQSYEWVFDIVPCFYTDTNLYLIPDGNGNWKSTDPRIDQYLVTSTNQNYNGKLLQLIRTLKYWNRYNSSYTIGSYLFEQIVINFAKTRNELSNWIDYDIRDFFYYLKSHIYTDVNDPKGIQGNLNNLTFEQKSSIADKANWAYNKAIEAITAETTEEDQEKAINKWREVFGTKFPIYE
ncbi:nucleotidyltransferase [Elizabethkingia anophelis]|uniref:Nucleotidyltransferase n=1 Tax=Elizabethkingia anophelis TaxID=1117645 RepID=A0AAE4NXV7_9FLAO|nr:nucleotidyltransferase [Elizabethkingia anophelis]MCT4061599.1 nucleotidyltransferase [Elizabethkingia anophelis]MCT4107845.1 nucleotidyltransferase [Elizabethkingia anophelis]MDV3662893.1 nucleotidyltransferase [Elizabethkingia anophelis]